MKLLSIILNAMKRLVNRNMVILKIKETGHSIDLPGLPGIKTPTEINITKMDIKVVLSILRKHGITKYEIIGKDKEVVIKKNKEQKIEPIIEKVVETVYVRDENSIELKSKVENIEKLLLGFLRDFKNTTVVNVENKVVKSKLKEKEIDEEVSFIPKIDISGMTSKGTINQTTSKNTDGNFEETVNLLKSLNLKNKQGKH